MSVWLQNVLEDAGYDIIENVEDAKWLLSQRDEFESLCEKAEECVDAYEDYQWEMQEHEDSGESGKIISFQEWRKIKAEEK